MSSRDGQKLDVGGWDCCDVVYDGLQLAVGGGRGGGDKKAVVV
jgi:hypothetical protein